MIEFKKQLQNLEARKFILTIGDEGVILAYVRGAKLELRLHAAINSQSDIKNLQTLLEDDPKAPIYVLVDVMDQSYAQQSLPAVSSLNINKLVKKRLERDYGADDIKGSLSLGRSKAGRKDWNFIFVSCPLAPPITTWLDFIMELPNRLAGIFMLPIEMESFLKKVNSVMFTDKTKEKSQWQILITHNKVGGFRQIAFKDEKIVFTRLISAGDTVPDIIAGNIEQELLNTVEYLRRLSFRDGDSFDLYIIVSQDIKFSLSSSKLQGRNIFLMTPFEVANKLQLKNSASQEDRFADVVIAVSFAQQKHILELHTPLTRKLDLMSLMCRWLMVAASFLIPVILIMSSMDAYHIYKMSQDIKYEKADIATIQERWQRAQKNNLSMEDISKISDVVTLYKLLSGSGSSPLTLISQFGSAKGADVLVKSIDWKVRDVTVKPGAQPGAANPPVPQPASGAASPMPGAPGADSAKNTGVTVTFDVEFYNTSASYEELFENFDIFITRLTKTFPQYDVEYTRLAEKISFNDKNKVIPVQVTISGPKDDKAKKG